MTPTAPTLALLLALSAPAAWAAPGTLVYQGRLKQSGLPVTGVRSVSVLLCPAAATPSASCVDTGAQSVSVANGLFRTTFTVPSAVDWSAGQWHLELNVDGSAFSPREPLSAAPYALRASSATTLAAESGSSSVVIATNVVVGGQLTLSGEGHLRLVSSASPALSASCGGGASVAGGDGAGRVTLGNSPVPGTSCTLTFAYAWSPNPPVCHFVNETQFQYLAGTAGTASVVFTAGGPALSAGDVIAYLCVGY